MKKINVNFPNDSLVIEKCYNGIIQNTLLKAKMESAKDLMLDVFVDYRMQAKSQNLYSILRYSLTDTNDPKVISDLLHSELTYIYSNFFSRSGKPARAVYDKIMISSNGKCPYCYIGSPIQLDHYLPKSKFPQFSVLTLNLIPSCERCNQYGKKAFFAKSKGQQILHPYLDNDSYFDEVWIKARMIGSNFFDIVVEYYVDPPEKWEEFRKERVTTHFEIFNLSERYSVCAAEEMSSFIEQFRSMIYRGNTSSDIYEILLDPIMNGSLPKNHWKRVMYTAIKLYVQQQKDLSKLV